MCTDVCDQVLAEERALREKMSREFSVGQKQRQKEIEEFQILLSEKEAEKAGIDDKLEKAEELVAEAEREFNQVKHEYMQQRVDRSKDLTKRIANAPKEGEPPNNGLSSLLEPLPNHEIIEFIVHSCQMAGEMEWAADLDESTCVPLRLAGVDSKILWGRENDGVAELKRLHTNIRDEGKQLADIMIHNANAEDNHAKRFMEEKEKRKHRKRKRRTPPGRRRLQEMTDDEVPEDDVYDSDEDPYADDYIAEDEENDHGNGAEVDAENQDEDNKEEEVDAEQAILDTLKESLFSQPRIAFLQRSSEIIEGINDLLKESDGGDENGDKAAEGEDIDPTAYNMVKSTLEGREQAIERGFDYGVSAKIMLNALVDSTDDQEGLRSDLQLLALGTLVHGKLSASHVWQLFQAILEEFHPTAEDTDKEAKTCATSPWVASCPPRALTIDSVSFPPKEILDAAQVLCTTPTFTKEKAQACAADADNELPTVMPDGYYGYEVTKPRENDDVLQKMAEEWDPALDEPLRSKLDELEEKKKRLDKEQKDIENSMDELNDLVEGAKESRFGIDGELYALKDTCSSVKAGKYTYELCFFESAAQKEGDAKSGTGLGQWEGVEHDDETGSRILKWTKGAKCWNGPQRSATAYVTCGAETKVLSADEPDTCRYVMQMESHIACDEAFQKLHEL